MDEPGTRNTNFERETVPLLNTNNSTYKRALHKFISDWLEEKIGSGAPTEHWDIKLVKKVNNEENLEDSDEETDAELTEVYQKLKKLKVHNHLEMVNSHRKWLRLTKSFLEKIGISFSERFAEFVRKHDLSKYSHSEVLGYSVMFGDQTGFKSLDDPEEKNEWLRALDHHYTVNQHHPEYFFPKLDDGTRDKSRGMSENDTDSEIRQDYLAESLVDMLASRGERDLRDDEMFSVSKWMDIDSRFMARYHDKDRDYVYSLLDQWKEAASLIDVGNTEILHCHFDKRPVVN